MANYEEEVYKHPQSTSSCGMQDDKSDAHEFKSVVYDVPVLKDHQNQTIITQDNVAYAGTVEAKTRNGTGGGTAERGDGTASNC